MGNHNPRAKEAKLLNTICFTAYNPWRKIMSKKIVMFVALFAMLALWTVSVQAVGPRIENVKAGDFAVSCGCTECGCCNCVPEYVIFKDGQFNGKLMVWGDQVAASKYLNTLNANWAKDEIATFGNENGGQFTAKNQTYGVKEVGGVWYAWSTGGISNLMFPAFTQCDPNDDRHMEFYSSGPTLSVEGEVKITEYQDLYTQWWQNEFTPWEEWTQYLSKSESSVTATNSADSPLVVANSNHFTYAVLPVADLEEGVALDLVVGNKIDLVGTAVATVVDGKLVLTFDDPLWNTSKFGAVVSDKNFNPKNGSEHSGQGSNNFQHNNVSVLDLPQNWDKNDVLYLYVHFDTYQANWGRVKTDSGTYEVVHERDLEFVDTNENNWSENVDYVIYDVNGAGDYTVTFDDKYCGDFEECEGTIEVSGSDNDGTVNGHYVDVTVAGSQNVVVAYSAEYTYDLEDDITDKWLKDIINATVIHNETVVGVRPVQKDEQEEEAEENVTSTGNDSNSSGDKGGDPDEKSGTVSTRGTVTVPTVNSKTVSASCSKDGTTTVIIVVNYSDLSSETITGTFKSAKNTSNTVEVGGYIVFVEINNGGNVKKCNFVE